MFQIVRRPEFPFQRLSFDLSLRLTFGFCVLRLEQSFQGGGPGVEAFPL